MVRTNGNATQATWIAIEMEEMSQLLRNTLSHDDKRQQKQMLDISYVNMFFSSCFSLDLKLLL